MPCCFVARLSWQAQAAPGLLGEETTQGPAHQSLCIGGLGQNSCIKQRFSGRKLGVGRRGGCPKDMSERGTYDRPESDRRNRGVLRPPFSPPRRKTANTIVQLNNIQCFVALPTTAPTIATSSNPKSFRCASALRHTSLASVALRFASCSGNRAPLWANTVSYIYTSVYPGEPICTVAPIRSEWLPLAIKQLKLKARPSVPC